MEKLKIDRSKLKTITNYAKIHGLTRQAVHYQAKKGYIKLVEIDGIKFIEVR